MVWLDEADSQALATSSSNFWLRVRDGQEPSTIPRPTFGFRVTKPFTSPKHQGEFLPGMQGQVIRCQDGAAFVEARDVFDKDGNFLKDWISCDVIEIGTKPYGTWEIDVGHVANTSSRLSPDNLGPLDDPKCRPISEAPADESHVWLRTDTYMPGESGKSIPVSNFRRGVPKPMTITPKNGTSGKPSFIVFEIADDSGYKMRIARSLPETGSNGLDWPAEDTHFDVTFEVRTDWKPHPYSWACLPLVGPFEDWDRANSWAVFIGWKDPSNQYRKKYLHCETPHTMVDKDSNGSIQPYVHGIEIIHWLYREKIPKADQHRWLQNPPMASVKVVNRDAVNQKITFESFDRIAHTAPISSRRKHPDVIREEMMGRGPHGDLGLLHVGVPPSGLQALKNSGVKFRDRRSECDTCMFFSSNTDYPVCKETDRGVCENCIKLYGRPFCSWSPDVPAAAQAGTNMAGNTYNMLESRNDFENILRRKALYGLKGSTGDSMMTADPIMLEVDE